MVDWNHIGMLLHIVDKSKDHPKLSALTQAALAELDEHASNAAEEQIKARQQAAEAEAKKFAEAKKAEEAAQTEAPKPSEFRRPIPSQEQSNGS